MFVFCLFVYAFIFFFLIASTINLNECADTCVRTSRWQSLHRWSHNRRHTAQPHNQHGYCSHRVWVPDFISTGCNVTTQTSTRLTYPSTYIYIFIWIYIFLFKDISICISHVHNKIPAHTLLMKIIRVDNKRCQWGFDTERLWLRGENMQIWLAPPSFGGNVCFFFCSCYPFRMKFIVVFWFFFIIWRIEKKNTREQVTFVAHCSTLHLFHHFVSSFQPNPMCSFRLS